MKGVKTKKIGLITIGQSPRTDVLPDLKLHLGPRVEVLEIGALDGLSLEQVQEFQPDPGMYVLITRMRDGTEVKIGKEKILPLIQGCIDALNKQKVSLIILFCVGAFPRFNSTVLIIEPQKIVDNFIKSILHEEHHLGILLPIKEQESKAKETFIPLTPNITTTSITPYSSDDDLEKICQKFVDNECDLVLMYCMGFNEIMAEKVRKTFAGPVVLVGSLVMRTVGELLE